MPTKRMLIDASHPEETRVAIVAGNHLEDFDVEVQSRRQLKGNIYLAKVTRVEPSLQAAFVDYGGNRHGFLAFNEIHPDYYQIPVADREALIAEQRIAAPPEHDHGHPREEIAGAEPPPAGAEPALAGAEPAAVGGEPAAIGVETVGVETVGGDIFEEVAARRPVTHRRRYKIQEVIKRRQIMLVQVVKEERGTKGAALTTYLSLAGRYCVLMPNTARGGGISRKISIGSDRKRLKSILSDFGIPDGMAVIVRTAGQTRSKAEIKRDYEYLMRLWSTIREVTLESMAPCLVHEEGDLIKRSIRDLYTKDIHEIVIDGDDSYRAAKDFMKLLIPSHTKRVQPFKEVDKQLFHFYGIEHHLDSMHSPEVQLRSGGYIVISPTEALVAIDVNSGRATRGRNIEETALKTNLEAAEEIALQLKLRDLAGLIVIDYIDMEDHRNQVKVERRLKESMRSDRARIQIGRISPFGLLELSRQRMRPSLIETSSEPCPYCEGTGIRRSKESAALHLLRAIEEEGMQHRSRQVTVYIPTPVALYLLNNKRAAFAGIEEKFKMSVRVESDETLIPPNFRIERIDEEGRPIVATESGSAQRDGGREEGSRRRRRRGRNRHGEEGGDGRHDGRHDARHDSRHDGRHEAPAADANTDAATQTDQAGQADGAAPAAKPTPGSADDGSAPRGKRRRRGRRGGRRRHRDGTGPSGPSGQPAQPGQPAPDGSGRSPADVDDNVILLGAPEPVVALAPPKGGDGKDVAPPKGGDGKDVAPPKGGDGKDAAPPKGGDGKDAAPPKGGDGKDAAPPPRKRGGRRRRGRGGAVTPPAAAGNRQGAPAPAASPSAPAASPPAPVQQSAAPVKSEPPAGATDAAKPAAPKVSPEATPPPTPEKPASTRKGWWSRVIE